MSHHGHVNLYLPPTIYEGLTRGGKKVADAIFADMRKIERVHKPRKRLATAIFGPQDRREYRVVILPRDFDHDHDALEQEEHLFWTALPHGTKPYRAIIKSTIVLDSKTQKHLTDAFLAIQEAQPNGVWRVEVPFDRSIRTSHHGAPTSYMVYSMIVDEQAIPEDH